MSQPTGIVFQYLGTVNVTKNITYTASQFVDLFPNSNIFVLKSNVGVKVSINKTPSFILSKEDLTYFDGTTSLNYVFDRDCLVAVGTLK